MMAIKAPFLRSAYNYDMDAASAASAIDFPDESLTVQSEKDDADLNVILKRFGVTGQLPQGFRAPTYGDFTGVGDYHSAMNIIRDAEENFMLLDASLRARFNNDPQQLLEFVSDSSNREEAIKLGIVDAPIVKVPDEPIRVRVIPEEPKA